MSDLKRMFRNKVAEYKKRYERYSEERFYRALEKAGEEDIRMREEAHQRHVEYLKKADTVNCGKGLFLSDVLYKK